MCFAALRYVAFAMRKSPLPSCPSRLRLDGLRASVLLASLALILSFQVLVAVPSSSLDHAPVQQPPSSPLPDHLLTSKEGNQEAISLSATPSELSKRLLQLNACLSDAQCWGRGRRCIEGRCWGFAGPRRLPFQCAIGAVCELRRIDGHFYGQGSKGSRGLFMLQAIQGPLAACGTGGSRPSKPALCEEDSPDCDLSQSGEQRKTSGHSVVGERDTFLVGAPRRCMYTPGITAQSACSLRLGFIPPSLPVGTYALCGCSSTDLGANGQPCSSEADFSIPVGKLEITGFASPAVSSAAAAAAAAPGAASSGSSDSPSRAATEAAEKQEEEASTAEEDAVQEAETLQELPSSIPHQQLLLPRFSCTVGFPCELPGIRGHGLNDEDHFVRAFSGIYGSCERAAKVSCCCCCCCCCCLQGGGEKTQAQDNAYVLLCCAAFQPSASRLQCGQRRHPLRSQRPSPGHEDLAAVCGSSSSSNNNRDK